MLSLAVLGRGGEKRRRRRKKKRRGSGAAEPVAKPVLPLPWPLLFRGGAAPQPARVLSGCSGTARLDLRAGHSGFCPKVTPLSDSGTSPEGLREGRLRVTHPPAPSRCLMAEPPPLRPRRCCPCSSSSSPAPAAPRPAGGSQASLCLPGTGIGGQGGSWVSPGSHPGCVVGHAPGVSVHVGSSACFADLGIAEFSVAARAG